MDVWVLRMRNVRWHEDSETEKKPEEKQCSICGEDVGQNKKKITNWRDLGESLPCLATQSRSKIPLLKIPHIFDTRYNAIRLKLSWRCPICCLSFTVLKGVCYTSCKGRNTVNGLAQLCFCML